MDPPYIEEEVQRKVDVLYTKSVHSVFKVAGPLLSSELLHCRPYFHCNCIRSGVLSEWMVFRTGVIWCWGEGIFKGKFTNAEKLRNV